ncbi:MAG: glycine cleavage system aminomethyltransferase GcvT [Candidatus Thermoplasmatota archaeon]
MKHTPLYQEHIRRGARLTEFAGWALPLYYTGVLMEHRAVRTSIGAFDTSHMTSIVISGQGAERLVSRAFTNDIRGSERWQAKYTHMLDAEGRIIDDMIVTKMDGEEYLCVANASTAERVVSWLRGLAEDACVEEITTQCGAVAIQGPNAPAVVERLLGTEAAGMCSFRAGMVHTQGMEWAEEDDARAPHQPEVRGFLSRIRSGEAFVSCTGYTGEVGFEVLLSSASTGALWRALLDAHGVTPAGLGARDTLRQEMGYLLSGQDFHEDRTPLEAGYAWVVKWNHDFVGREALLAQRETGGYERFMGVVLDTTRVPRSGCRISRAGREIGKVTSGTLSPTLQRGIALGYVKGEEAVEGTVVELEIRGNIYKGLLQKPPLIRKGRERRRAMEG